MGFREYDLVVTRNRLTFCGQNPNLKQGARIRFTAVVFRMGNTGTGAHSLNFTRVQLFPVAHGIRMFQYTGQRYGDDFHVVVGMRTKTHSRCNPIVVPNAQATKIYLFRIVPAGEGKRMIGLQPAVVCVTASGGGVQYFFQCFNFEKSEKKAREAGRKKYLITNLLSKEFDEIRYPNADTLG